MSAERRAALSQTSSGRSAPLPLTVPPGTLCGFDFRGPVPGTGKRASVSRARLWGRLFRGPRKIEVVLLAVQWRRFAGEARVVPESSSRWKKLRSVREIRGVDCDVGMGWAAGRRHGDRGFGRELGARLRVPACRAFGAWWDSVPSGQRGVSQVESGRCGGGSPGCKQLQVEKKKCMLIWAEAGLYFKCFARKNLHAGAGLIGLKVVRLRRQNLR